MASIVAIVEGHGEEEAVPILLRRIAEAVAPTADIDILPPIRVERNAKGWLTARMPAGRSYRPTRHQAALTDHFDLDAARRSAPSFDKLWRDVGALLATDTP